MTVKIFSWSNVFSVGELFLQNCESFSFFWKIYKVALKCVLYIGVKIEGGHICLLIYTRWRWLDTADHFFECSFQSLFTNSSTRFCGATSIQCVVLILRPSDSAFEITESSKEPGWNQTFLTFFAATWSKRVKLIWGFVIKTTKSGISGSEMRSGQVLIPSISSYLGLMGKKVWFQLMIRFWILSARLSGRGEAPKSAIFMSKVSEGK